MRSIVLPASLLALFALAIACSAPPPPASEVEASTTSVPVPLSGPYLGQQPPGAEPRVFAPGIVSTGMAERDMAITPEGDQIFFSASVGARSEFSAILTSRLQAGVWTAPEVTDFSGSADYMEIEPFVTPDGSRLFFVSDRPREEGKTEPADHDIWVVDRQGTGWGEPYNLGAPVNTEASEFFPTLTRDGTIYFTREDRATGTGLIMRARPIEGGFAEPEPLPDHVQAGAARFNAGIAPDESYLLLPVFGREDSLGATDYYIAFRSEDDVFGEPIHLGDRVNSPNGLEYSAYVSPDGAYLFFMSGRTMAPKDADGQLTRATLEELHGRSGNGQSDIYWVDASFLEDLRPAPEAG